MSEAVNAGTGATAENLAKAFGLEGATEVDGDYSVDNVAFTFGTPIGGKVVISALPADETATQFFILSHTTVTGWPMRRRL